MAWAQQRQHLKRERLFAPSSSPDTIRAPTKLEEPLLKPLLHLLLTDRMRRSQAHSVNRRRTSGPINTFAVSLFGHPHFAQRMRSKRCPLPELANVGTLSGRFSGQCSS